MLALMHRFYPFLGNYCYGRFTVQLPPLKSIEYTTSKKNNGKAKPTYGYSPFLGKPKVTQSSRTIAINHGFWVTQVCGLALKRHCRHTTARLGP